MRALQSLRGRVALLATLAVAVVLLAVGATAVASFADRERERVDQSLEGRPVNVLVRALGGFEGRPPPPPPGERPPPGADHLGRGPFHGPPPGDMLRRAPRLGPEALRPEGEYTRVVSGGSVVREVDAPEDLPLPAEPGLRTVESDGDRYRSLTRPAPDGLLLEVGTDLGPVDERVGSLRNRLLLLGLLAVLLVAALSWWLAGVALRPLRELRAGVGRVSDTRDLGTRLAGDGAPEEVAELTGGVNAMLGRLERSSAEREEALEATRRFAGDAGHELRTPMTALRANLGTLRRNPDLSADERRTALEAADREAGRAARLLEVLQTLARGDAGAALPRERVDFSALVDAAVEAARARHPEASFSVDAPPEELALEGWPDGLRAIVDNLLDNAARHGRPGGAVSLALRRGDGGLSLTVDDDGPGVPEGEEELVFERFRRGTGSRAEGSGLGLAVVRQQAQLHGGEVEVGRSPAGGARFAVRLG